MLTHWACPPTRSLGGSPEHSVVNTATGVDGDAHDLAPVVDGMGFASRAARQGAQVGDGGGGGVSGGRGTARVSGTTTMAVKAPTSSSVTVTPRAAYRHG